MLQNLQIHTYDGLKKNTRCKIFHYRFRETDGYGTDKRPETEKLTRKEITITETSQKLKRRKKP